MEEIWKPINPILDIEDCYEASSLGRIRNTRYNKIQDDIHHSTNGFDYIFIATKEHKPSYQHIDLIVCSTFHPYNTGNIENAKPVIPYHIDGDTRNNKASNLKFVEDVEKWKPVIYKDIVPCLYEISNFGNIRNVETGHLYSINATRDHYRMIEFWLTNGSRKCYMLHRLIATAFVPNISEVVNHIDNNRNNNHWRNLEWCTYGWNNVHGVTVNMCISLIDEIRTILIKNHGSVHLTRVELLSNNIDMASELIHRIKFMKMTSHSFKFTQSELIELSKLVYEKETYYKLTNDEIKLICKTLVNNNFQINETYTHLKNEGLHISKSQLRRIRRKAAHKDISDEYF